MRRSKILATGLTLGVVLSGCGKTHTKQQVPAGRAESAEVRHDLDVAARVRKEVGLLLKKAPDSIHAADEFVRDLGADSLDTVEIVMATEEAFGITIADDDAEKLITVGDLIDYVSNKIRTAPATNKPPGPSKGEAGWIPGSGGGPVRIVAKFVEITSGTEELSFDWIVKPFGEEAVAPATQPETPGTPHLPPAGSAEFDPAQRTEHSPHAPTTKDTAH